MRKATEKEKVKMREYYQNHKDKIKSDAKNFYKNNQEKMKAKMRENYIWNRFERIIKARKYYQEHREEILAKMSEFAKQNRDVMNKKRIAYETKHPEKVLARNQARYRIKIPKNQMCEICEVNKATDREHRDYSKPLEVQFTCHQCNCKLERLPICQ